MTQRLAREVIANRIAGEIVLSARPGSTMRKWRELFGLLQTELAIEMGIAPSVLSDYESGRRSPGSKFVKRFVEALIALDERKGGKLIVELSRISGVPSGAILDLREFPAPVGCEEIRRAVEGEVVACPDMLHRSVYGYTVIDSIRAITALHDFLPIFGLTSERALVFTNVSSGRSPMVAIRVAPLKPRMVVLHRPEKVDRLAIELAEIERIPLVRSKAESVESLIEGLRKLYEAISR